MDLIKGIETEFSKVKTWFAKVFKALPAWNVIAATALNVAAPLVETIVDLANPAAGAILTPILTKIQADFGTVASLLASGNTTNLATFLNAIKTNLPQLLVAAQITDPDSVAKSTAAVTTIASEIDAILAAIPA